MATAPGLVNGRKAMLLRRNEFYLLHVLGQMLKQEMRKQREKRDLEYIATIKSVITIVRGQIRQRKNNRR